MSEKKKFKRQRRDEPRPEFLDFSASISAAGYGSRRLPELHALWKSVAPTPLGAGLTTALTSGGGKTSSRHLRRRTTSYKPRRYHRKHTRHHDDPTKTDGTDPPQKSSDEKRPCRRARRKAARLQSERQTWMIKSAQANEKDHWLPTHLWHAKRFHMLSLFGWKVPIMSTNRGGRAAIRLVQEGNTLIHDLTWREGNPLVFSSPNVDELLGTLRLLNPSIMFTHESLLSGSAMMEVVLHEPTKFPGGTIGPCRIWLRKDGTRSQSRLILHVHPSIRGKVRNVFLSALPSEGRDKQAVVAEEFSAVAYIQLTGLNASDCIEKTLQLRKRLPRFPFDHLGIHKTDFSLPLRHDRTVVDEDVSFVCRKASTPAGNGWDVICRPEVAKDVFVALVLGGKACAIGLLEEGSLSRECRPPKMMFPRDYPDTKAGVAYWSEESNEWDVYRYILEAHWGRVRLDSNALKAREKVGVDFGSAAALSEASEPKALPTALVIRGAFGQPFVKLLNPTVDDEDDNSKTKKTRRMRRRASVCQAITLVPPMSKEERKDLGVEAQNLLETLVLPTLIRCSLQVRGKGNLVPGDDIRAIGGSLLLGFVTVGAFSALDGACIGTGFVGGRRFLEIMRRHPRFVRRRGQEETGVEVSCLKASSVALFVLL